MNHVLQAVKGTGWVLRFRRLAASASLVQSGLSLSLVSWNFLVSDRPQMIHDRQVPGLSVCGKGEGSDCGLTVTLMKPPARLTTLVKQLVSLPLIDYHAFSERKVFPVSTYRDRFWYLRHPRRSPNPVSVVPLGEFFRVSLSQLWEWVDDDPVQSLRISISHSVDPMAPCFGFSCESGLLQSLSVICDIVVLSAGFQTRPSCNLPFQGIGISIPKEQAVFSNLSRNLNRLVSLFLKSGKATVFGSAYPNLKWYPLGLLSSISRALLPSYLVVSCSFFLYCSYVRVVWFGLQTNTCDCTFPLASLLVCI